MGRAAIDRPTKKNINEGLTWRPGVDRFYTPLLKVQTD